MENKENVSIESGHGFIYEVVIEHYPHFGFSKATYKERIIGQCELGSIHCPNSDSDIEWEMYEERFGEWKDEILTNIKPQCVEYFNDLEKRS